MTTTFMSSPSLLLTSESVTEGHPDKLCDQVSDAVLDAMLQQDPMSRVACEAAVNTGFVFILGEISTNAYVDLQEVVRNTVRDIGYNDSKIGFDWETCGVISSIKEQAGDIAQGVNKSYEARMAGGEVEQSHRQGDVLAADAARHTFAVPAGERLLQRVAHVGVEADAVGHLGRCEAV